MKVKCIDNHLKEKVITEGKDYLVESVGIGKYVITNDKGQLDCINQSRFTAIEDNNKFNTKEKIKMEQWTLLKCLNCDFPFIINSKEYVEVINSDYPFIYCPKCGKEINVSKDAFQKHIELPFKVKKVVKYIVTDK